MCRPFLSSRHGLLAILYRHISLPVPSCHVRLVAPSRHISLPGLPSIHSPDMPTLLRLCIGLSLFSDMSSFRIRRSFCIRRRLPVFPRHYTRLICQGYRSPCRMPGIIPYPCQWQQKEEPEKPSPPLPILPNGWQDQRWIFFQVGHQLSPVGAIRPQRVLFSSPPQKIVQVVVIYV